MIYYERNLMNWLVVPVIYIKFIIISNILPVKFGVEDPWNIMAPKPMTGRDYLCKPISI